ncbi:hypothetical protein E4U53_005084, partial [Claviceps sorghi]
LFRVHYDNCNFRYEVNLVRGNHLESGQNERYVLYLFESNAKPPLFWFAAKYFRRKGDSQPAYFRPSNYSGPFDDELRHFKSFFQTKTGIEWEDRVTHYGVMPASFFTYTPPSRGKPIGRETLFSAKMSWELNAALRGIPGPSIEESAEEVQTEGVGGAVLGVDDAAVVIEDALLENAHLEEADGDEGIDWSLVDVEEHDIDLEACGVATGWNDSQGEDGLGILGDSSTTNSPNGGAHGGHEFLRNTIRL